MFSNIKNRHKVLTQRTQSVIFVSVADDIHVTEGSIRNVASEIYANLGVRNRMELIMLLKDKRIK